MKIRNLPWACLRGERPVQTGLNWSFIGPQIPRLWRTEDRTTVFGPLRSWEFAVLIGLGPVQSRSFSGYKTRLPNTTWYYNQRRLPTPTYKQGDMVYLDALDIKTTRPSHKLSHRRLGPFPIEKRVSHNAYNKLCLPFSMRHLHPVFNIIKLTAAPTNPIPGCHPTLPPPPEIIEGEEEYLVEEILDSKMFQGKLKFKIKWEGYGPEHDSWEYAAEVHAPERVADFYQKNPAAPRKFEPPPSHKFCSNH